MEIIILHQNSNIFRNNRERKRRLSGFTMIEILITLAIVAILATVVILIINPARQLGMARNNQRISHINVILNAISQNMGDNKGSFGCVIGDIPTSSVKMASGAGNYDIAQCLVVPNYLSNIPFDPTASGAHYSSSTDYDTGYYLSKNASTSRITIVAPSAEAGQAISVTR